MVVLSALVLGFFFVELAGYLFHRLLHTAWTGSLHRAHMNHHLRQYPPHDYLSETYRKAGTDSATIRFFILGVFLAILFVWLTPLVIAIALILNLAIVGIVNNYIHDSTHIRGHWLERYSIFLRWRRIHYLHHIQMGKNFGIITFLSDRLAGTYISTNLPRYISIK